jgi:CRP-like cAMP-binding protein
MISPEILRRYPFFAGLDHEHIMKLAVNGEEKVLEAGEFYFHEGDKLKEFYLLIEGAVSIAIEIPDREADQPVSEQLVGSIKMKSMTVSTVGTGDAFGWPGLIPPNDATAGAKALTDCRAIAFDCEKIQEEFEKDPLFGFVLTQRIAQVIRDRLRDMRIESLAFSS